MCGFCETARRYSNEDQKVEIGIEEKGEIEGARDPGEVN